MLVRIDEEGTSQLSSLVEDIPTESDLQYSLVIDLMYNVLRVSHGQ